MLKALVVLGMCLMVTADRVHYDGYKVLRMTPENEAQAKIIQELEAQGIPFWSGPNPVNKPSDVMFPPHMQGDIVEALQNSGMKISEYVSDVEKFIVEQDKDIQDDESARANFNFGAYHTLAQAYAFLDEIASEHAHASVIDIGTSFENRPLKVLKISKSGETKPAIWFDSNIHAREWITSAVCLYVINELLTSTDPAVMRWTEDYDWYIMPHHNPDGFEYSRTTDRMWRKTRSTTSSPLGCRGADPNRNWNFHWLGGGSSTNPCTDTYAGPSAFSEKETKAASDFQADVLGSRLSFVLSLHSYSQYILIPYGVRVPFPPHQEYMRIGQATAQAIQQRYGTRFTPGNIVDLLYVASGGSGDWAHGVRNVDLTFTFEMRDTGSYGFLLPASQILPSSYEFMDGLHVMIRELGGMLAKKEAAKAQ
jgi:hypothetical protein